MTYHIEYTRAAAKQIAGLPRIIQQRIFTRIEALSQSPRPSGAVKLSGHDAFRIRIGDYRVIYAVADERLVVLIVEVGHRRNVYRNW